MIQEKSGFWDSIDATSSTPGDERNYAAREMVMPTRLLLSNGVDPEPDSLKVLPGAYERSTQIMLGYAWIRGRWYALEDDGTGGAETLTLLHDAPVQYNRIDRIVLRYDENFTLDGRYVRAVVLKGMEAEVPAAPELTTSEEIEEISLARVLVKPSQMTILEADIADERDDETVCGRARLRPGQDVTAHAGRHAAGGSDPITPASIGAAEADLVAELGSDVADLTADVVALELSEQVKATAGAAPSFTVADTSVTAYTSGLRRTVQFHAAGTNATLNFNGLGAKALYEYTGKQMSVKAGQVVEVCYNGTYFFGVSLGGGVEFPATPSAGDTPIYAKNLSGNFSSAGTLRIGAGYGFTAKIAGVYRITYSLFRTSNGVTPQLFLYKNGVQVVDSGISATPMAGKVMDISLAANDLVELYRYLESAQSGNYVGGFFVSLLAADVQTAINTFITPTTA
ncbi:MAG TPA: hypothetical protein PKB13_08950 [Clostridia bacterium]|nr:hypothetical protein [Clostridia bacterium]